MDGLTTKASRVMNLEVLALPGKYGFPETNMLGKPATWVYKMKPGECWCFGLGIKVKKKSRFIGHEIGQIPDFTELFPVVVSNV